MSLTRNTAFMLLGLPVLALACGKSSASSEPVAQTASVSAPVMNEQEVSASEERTSRPSAEEIVRAIANAYESLPPFSMRIDRERWETGRRWISSIELRMDADRFDQISTIYRVEEGEAKLSKKERSLWTGEQYVHWTPGRRPYHPLTNPAPNAWASDQKEWALRGIRNLGAPYLLGVFPDDSAGIGTMLNQAFHLSVREEMEEVGGHACYVIEASTRWGAFKLWVDPAYGFNIRRALLEKTEGHSYNGRPLPVNSRPPGANAKYVIRQVNYEFKGVEIERIEDYYVPVAGELWTTMVYGDGRRVEYHSTNKCSEIVWNPDFEKMGAFVMDEIPDGERLHLTIGNDGGRPILAEWRNGKAVRIRWPTPIPSRRPIS